MTVLTATALNPRKKIMLYQGKEQDIDLDGSIYHCTIDIAMHFMGGKWKSVILWYLSAGKKRFNELNKLIPGITEKTLSLQLRRLEKDGLINRTVYPEVPPHVEYYLSEEGKSLIPALKEISSWGMRKAKLSGTMIDSKATKTHIRNNKF